MLEKCESISIRQDSGDGWLAVGFAGSDRNLNYYAGVLGAEETANYKDLTTENLLDATVQVFKRASTRNLQMPGPETLDEDMQAASVIFST